MSHDRERDRRLVERVAEHYRPEPLTAAQRARFDARLRERLAPPRRIPVWTAAVAAAAAAAWLAWPALWSTPQEPPPPRLAQSTGESGWEEQVMLSDSDPTLDEEEYLPDEYLVIALAFLEDA